MWVHSSGCNLDQRQCRPSLSLHSDLTVCQRNTLDLHITWVPASGSSALPHQFPDEQISDLFAVLINVVTDTLKSHYLTLHAHPSYFTQLWGPQCHFFVPKPHSTWSLVCRSQMCALAALLHCCASLLSVGATPTTWALVFGCFLHSRLHPVIKLLDDMICNFTLWGLSLVGKNT